MPGHDHGPSIKKPRVYEALRRKGYAKSKAAAISNAMVKRNRRSNARVSRRRRKK